ncbi:MAG: helix-turn-helix transcriptional regulator [Albidovulum sp.]|uniref:helix-turn-helix transcriptional regulator n=1 Tax=Albidovulum sp. TaxID=1872424 RepID=UPI003CB5F16B
MSTEFALDLRKARRVAGFSQEDVAHLMGQSSTVISRLENGERRPSLVQIITLSLIYGRSFESFFAMVMAEIKKGLRARILTMPEAKRAYAGVENRAHTIESLARRLAEEDEDDGA